MWYVTFGLLSVTAESGISTFGRPLPDISYHTPCTRVQCVSVVIHYLPSVSEACFFFLYVGTSLVTWLHVITTLHRQAQQLSVSSQLGNSDSLNSLTSRKIQTRFSEIWHSFSGTSLLRWQLQGQGIHCLRRPPTQRVHVTSIIRWRASSQQWVRPVSLSVSDVVICTHVCRMVSSCIAALHQLRSSHHLVSATVFLSLHWFCVDSTMEMAHWSPSRIAIFKNPAGTV